MTETETQKRVNHHRVKNEAYTKYWKSFVIEPKGESPKDCAEEEKKHPLKNVEKPEDSGCRIDNAEIGHMIKNSHPDPKKGKNS